MISLASDVSVCFRAMSRQKTTRSVGAASQPLGQSFEELLAVVDGVADKDDFGLGVFNEGLNGCGGVGSRYAGDFRAGEDKLEQTLGRGGALGTLGDGLGQFRAPHVVENLLFFALASCVRGCRFS